jgi:cellulose synthase/poly-beta-1,6-N-acetylglucosamine synthase-like glycosyltransferase
MVFILITYIICIAIIFFYSLFSCYLAFFFNAKNRRVIPIKNWEKLPKVTIQLPIFNEKYVVSRLIDKICFINYPKDLLEIQI